VPVIRYYVARRSARNFSKYREPLRQIAVYWYKPIFTALTVNNLSGAGIIGRRNNIGVFQVGGLGYSQAQTPH
jgi:hypothetical protein